MQKEVTLVIRITPSKAEIKVRYLHGGDGVLPVGGGGGSEGGD